MLEAILGIGTIGLIVLGALIFVALAFALIYNSLVSLRARIDNAWAQIDVQLKKRYDLVPNLVETVKGYAKQEKSIFENVAAARSAWANASSVKDKAKADASFAGALKSLIAVSENYPTLRSNENFKMLQEQLDGIESKIAYTRQFYNDSVLEYNTSIMTIPNNIVAGMFGFVARDYFKVENEEERKNVQVKF